MFRVCFTIEAKNRADPISISTATPPAPTALSRATIPTFLLENLLLPRTFPSVELLVRTLVYVKPTYCETMKLPERVTN